MLTVNEISTILKNERKTGELLSLPKEFYTSAEETLKASGASDTSEYSSISKLIGSLKERRIQKLLVYLAYNKNLPQPIPSEEEDLYIQIKKILNKKVPEIKAIKIKITKKIPQVIAPSGNSVGPFDQDETVYLSEMADVKFIIDNKLGEIAN
jgi:DNA replication initiation complex subunit (GINS family)